MTPTHIRRTAILIPAAILAITLAACSGATPDASNSPSAPRGDGATGLADGIPTEEITTTENTEISAKLPADFGDTLNDAIDLSSPPARLVDENGDPAGFDVDFSKLLAQKLGLESNVMNVPFAQIIPGLAADRYHLSIDNFSRTPEREAQVDMVEYMYGSGGIAFAAGNPNEIDENLISLCGLHLGVLSGSYQESTTVPELNEECDAEGLEEATTTSYGSNNEAILALGSKRIDAWLGNGTVAAYAAAQQPNVFESATLEGTWTHDNITLPKGSPLTPIVAEAFQELIDEGTYMQVLEKWGIDKYALDKTSTTQTEVVQQ